MQIYYINTLLKKQIKNHKFQPNQQLNNCIVK